MRLAEMANEREREPRLHRLFTIPYISSPSISPLLPGAALSCSPSMAGFNTGWSSPVDSMKDFIESFSGRRDENEATATAAAAAQASPRGKRPPSPLPSPSPSSMQDPKLTLGIEFTSLTPAAPAKDPNPAPASSRRYEMDSYPLHRSNRMAPPLTRARTAPAPDDSSRTKPADIWLEKSGTKVRCWMAFAVATIVAIVAVAVGLSFGLLSPSFLFEASTTSPPPPYPPPPYAPRAYGTYTTLTIDVASSSARPTVATLSASIASAVSGASGTALTALIVTQSSNVNVTHSTALSGAAMASAASQFMCGSATGSDACSVTLDITSGSSRRALTDQTAPSRALADETAPSRALADETAPSRASSSRELQSLARLTKLRLRRVLSPEAVVGLPLLPGMPSALATALATAAGVATSAIVDVVEALDTVECTISTATPDATSAGASTGSMSALQGFVTTAAATTLGVPLSAVSHEARLLYPPAPPPGGPPLPSPSDPPADLPSPPPSPFPSPSPPPPPSPPPAGCTNTAAYNYRPFAVVDDGSCFIGGCTDSRFPQYNPAASYDNGGCAPPVPGCTNTAAVNYQASATRAP